MSGILHCCVVRISATEHVWWLFIYETMDVIRCICPALLLMFCKQSLREFYFATKTLSETGSDHINPSLRQSCFAIHNFDHVLNTAMDRTPKLSEGFHNIFPTHQLLICF